MCGWHFAVTVCGFISLVSLLTAMGSDHWLDFDNASMGLWEACADSTLGTACINLGMSVDGTFHATRAFLILSMLAGFIACGLLCALRFYSEIGFCSTFIVAMISCHIAGAFALIAMTIFAGTPGGSSSPSKPYGWSTVPGWVCGPLFHLTGILFYKIDI